jgi:membrane protein DedA with SNARE-associated domain
MPGAIVEPQTLYDLGREWYATRLLYEWRRPGQAEAQQMFSRHGLHGAFWSLG